MNNRFTSWLRTSWRILTEVPGWPDAPVSMQLRRAMPVLLPCAGMVLLLDWNLLFHAPRVREQGTALSPLLNLEAELSTLRLESSVQQLEETRSRAAAASHLLLASPADVPGFLQSLKADAARSGWDATFIASDPANSPPAQGAVVGLVPVRAKLAPLSTNQEVFASLVQLTGRLSASDKRIDLIRLSVRADEHRWQLVELNFRLCYALPR